MPGLGVWYEVKSVFSQKVLLAIHLNKAVRFSAVGTQYFKVRVRLNYPYQNPSKPIGPQPIGPKRTQRFRTDLVLHLHATSSAICFQPPMHARVGRGRRPRAGTRLGGAVRRPRGRALGRRATGLGATVRVEGAARRPRGRARGRRAKRHCAAARLE